MVIKRITTDAQRITLSAFSLNAESFEMVMFTSLSKLEKLDLMVTFTVTTIFEDGDVF